MTHRFIPTLGAAALIAALPAFAAAADAGRDDAVRPEGGAATWVTAPDRAPVVTPDVVYPGPHQAVVKALPQRTASAAATFDDTTYPVADTPAPRRAPERAARADARSARADGRLACGCPRQ